MKLSDAIALYINLRDEKGAKKKAFMLDVEELDRKLSKLESLFLKAFEKSGQTSAKAATGTAFIKERTSDKVVDREAYIAFLKAEGAYDMIESRINKTALDEYIEEHDDLPPGITRIVERKINVRRT
jgi:hypothetical protein